jgi:hypothetical protein
MIGMLFSIIIEYFTQHILKLFFKMEQNRQPSLIRHLVLKFFCLHDLIEIDSIRIVNDLNHVVRRKNLYKCTKCGKLKIIEL